MRAQCKGIPLTGIPAAGIKPQGIPEPKTRITKTGILRAYQNGADGEASADAMLRLAATGNGAALGYILDAIPD